MLSITSLDNPKIKQLLNLREKRERDATQTFLIEGFREVTRALAGKVKMKQLYICPEFFLGENEEALIIAAEKSGAEIIECNQKVFAKASYRDRPDGLIAVGCVWERKLDSLSAAKNPLFVVAEHIEKPGNLGTILRTSDAAGANGVIVADRCTDIYNPNVVRASVGTLFTLPVLETSSQETIQWLKKNGVHILAATPHAKKLYTEVDMCAPIAIVVGAEQVGLSQQWIQEADLQVRIPMNGVADSLNVAMATTILLYEAVRQRSC